MSLLVLGLFVILISDVVGTMTICVFHKCRCWNYDCFCF